MKFIKENFHDVLKLYINQIGIVIFTLALIFPLQTIEAKLFENQWDLLASVIATVFYFVLLYYVVWEIGAKDRIRVDSGRYSKTPAKGAILGLCANIPNFFFSSMLLIFSIIHVASGACTQLFAIFRLITPFHEGMYMGTVLAIAGEQSDHTSPVQILVAALFLLLPMLSVGVMHLAYTLGFKEIKIFAFLNPKSKK